MHVVELSKLYTYMYTYIVLFSNFENIGLQYSSEKIVKKLELSHIVCTLNKCHFPTFILYRKCFPAKYYINKKVKFKKFSLQ